MSTIGTTTAAPTTTVATNTVAPTTPVVSIASSSSSGATGGSVIDVSSLVSQLVTATYAAQVSNNASQTSAVTAQISALGTLKSALSTFQAALSSLDTPQSFSALTATSSDQSAFTATADSSAVAGTYSIGVTQLAQAQQLVSLGFAGGSDATVGTGTLTVSLGGQSFSINIDDTDNTLSGIVSAINSATGNPGVTATLVQGTDGAHLVLASALTGAANTIQVSSSGGDGGLAQLDYSPTATGNYTQAAAPQDAIVNVAGISYQSPSNTVTGAISGVTLNLAAATAAGSNATVTVSNDTSTVASNISNFVAAYNTLVQTFSSLGGYDASSGTAGPMLGNALLTGIQNQIEGVVQGLVSGGSSAVNSLASIGVTTQSDGTLALDSSTLQNALSSNFSAVSQLFSSNNGIAAQLNTQLTAALSNSGPVDSYSQTLVQQNAALTSQSNDLTNEENALTASMTQQFSALNTLLSSLQTTSAYLTQAFSDLPKVGGDNSSS
jgi:flagellar hook-associated protein 2